jgi:hypothetical protein
MITLTTPPQVNTVVGGSMLVSFGKFVISPFRFDALNKRVDASIVITSTTDPQQSNLSGNLTIDYNTGGSLLLAIDQLDIRRRINLTAGQINAIAAVVNSAQDSLEAGLISLGLVAGTQSSGV